MPPIDRDPAAPDTGAHASDDDIRRANFGEGGVPLGGEIPLRRPGAAPTVVPFAIQRALDFLQACETSNPRVTYKLGAKCDPGAVPGVDFTAIDCSGFVREAVRRATTLGNAFPDGSVVQHQWVSRQGFEKDTVIAASGRDGVVRIAFLAPADAGPQGIGHVALVYNGKTLESHGGVGPDSRLWTGDGWQSRASIYVFDR